MGLNPKTNKRYISVLSSDGTFREVVPQGTEGSVVREWETKDGKSGVKHELVWRDFSARIKNIAFQNGDYGEQMQVEFEDEGVSFTWSQVVSSPFTEDFLKKLPNIQLEHPIWLRPYYFLDEDEKPHKGVSLKQGENKIKNFFWDSEKKVTLNGFPVPQGDTENYNSDLWKVYFIQARQWLINYVKENICPKFVTPVTPFDYPDSSDAENIPL